MFLFDSCGRWNKFHLRKMKHFSFSEGGEGGGDTSIVRQEEIDRISRKLATLEMKVYRDTYRLCLVTQTVYLSLCVVHDNWWSIQKSVDHGDVDVDIWFNLTLTLPGTEWERACRPCHEEIWTSSVSYQATRGKECRVGTKICRGQCVLNCLIPRYFITPSRKLISDDDEFSLFYRSASWILNLRELSGSLGTKYPVIIHLMSFIKVNLRHVDVSLIVEVTQLVTLWLSS